jgi:DNA ligase-1
MKIKYIKKIPPQIKYDIEVETTSNFFANRILIHNSRCIATKDGLFTRTGERYITVPHLEKDMEPWFEKYPDSVLDGELYSHEHRQQLNELIKLVRKTVHITNQDLIDSENIVRYYVYDGVFQDGQSYTERKAFIDNNLMNITQYCASVADVPLSNESNLHNFYNSVLELGEEGIMIRNKNSLYENKRSKNLLKLKPEDDDTCIILAVKEGEGNWSNKCKTFTVEWEGRVFDASLKGSMEDAIDIWNNQDQWIGTRRTFLYMGLTGLGTPSYARIDYNNCIPSI